MKNNMKLIILSNMTSIFLSLQKAKMNTEGRYLQRKPILKMKNLEVFSFFKFQVN